MAVDDRQVIGGMLQAMEHLLDTADAAATTSAQLIKAQREGKPLAPATLTHYDQQLVVFDEKKKRFRELLGQWWTMLESDRPN